MKYYYTNVKEKIQKVYILIPMILFLIISMIVLTKTIQGLSYNEKKGNMIYVQILNKGMPLVKELSFDSEDLVEGNFSLKDKVLDVLGINRKDPINIISKEIKYFSMLKSENSKEAININKEISSFKLGDTSVSKVSEKEMQKGKGSNLASLKAYNPSLKKTLNSSKPEVLIYHTHTSERYTTDVESNSNDSMNENENVCAVGNEIARELEENYGISVIHDKTVHNTTYTQSYSRSRETLTQYLNKYGDFKLIIDLHRDSVKSKSSVTVNLNGEDVTKIMFVMTEKNPHFDKNNAIVENMIGNANELFPGFIRQRINYNVGTRYFNQDLSNNAILIEVGARINKIEEATGSAKYTARLIAEYLNGKE